MNKALLGVVILGLIVGYATQRYGTSRTSGAPAHR
jgi:hypothetical protein